MTTRAERLVIANSIIYTIATTGHKHLSYKDAIGYLEEDSRKRIWYVDPYTKKRVYTHYKGEWRGFNGGGTLHSLIEYLKNYVVHEWKVNLYAFGYRPEWLTGGYDIFRYREDITKVWEAARPVLNEEGLRMLEATKK